MKRHGRVRVTFRGHAEDSYASLELPVEEVVSGLVDFHGAHGPEVKPPLEIEGAYPNGDGVRVTIERVAAADSRPVTALAKPRIEVTRVVRDKDVRGVIGKVIVVENKEVELSVLASCYSRKWTAPALTADRFALWQGDVETFAQAARTLFEAYAREFGSER
jgi:hypothetical protein